MTTPNKKSAKAKEDAKHFIQRRLIGFPSSTDDIANLTYRQLQLYAKSMDIPCNLKKTLLKKIIIAKMEGMDEEAKEILKHARETRLLRKIQKKATDLEKSKASSVSIEEKNTKTGPVGNEGRQKKDKVKNLLKSMLEVKPLNVKLQLPNLHSRCRALLVPGNWKLSNGSDRMSSFGSLQVSGTVFGSNSTSHTMLNLPNTVTYQHKHQETNNMSVATSAVTSQCNGISRPPESAVSVRETLLQQYQKKPSSYGSERYVDNKSWSKGVIVRHHSNIVSASHQPPPNYNSQVCSSQALSTESAYFQLPPMSHNYQANQQNNRNQHNNRCFGGYHHGIQQSTPYNGTDNFVGAQNNSQVCFNNSVASLDLQPAYPVHNTGSFTNNVLYQDMFGDAPEQGRDLVDMTQLSSAVEACDTDLGMLANMAVTKFHEVTETQNAHNNLLMIGEDNCSSSGSKPLTQSIPSWNSLMDQMSINLSPSTFNHKAAMFCKYGCHAPCSNRSEQLDHEQSCFKQPMECPIVGCNFTTQLGSITTHLLNSHTREVKHSNNEAFCLDFTNGRCSFEQNIYLLKYGPKNLRFCQVVDGRVFVISAIGDFDKMQVAVFIQYVNDYYSHRSHVACEVVRSDGLPLQYVGEAYPITYPSLHLFTRRKCLIFNMNPRDPSQNRFILHTKIQNYI